MASKLQPAFQQRSRRHQILTNRLSHATDLFTGASGWPEALGPTMAALAHKMPGTRRVAPIRNVARAQRSRQITFDRPGNQA